MLKSLVSGAVLGGALLACLPAQQVTLLRNWDRASGVRYNDVWGLDHVDPTTGQPTGRSFVLVGETRGIWVLETTDPNNIIQRRWWSAPSSTWRDFTNVGNYVYVSTENQSQRGFRVIDFTDPGNIRDRGYVQTGTLVNAHNVSADTKNGFIYFSGSNQGVAIYDVKANPRNPTLVASWSRHYVHDICIRRDRAYFSMGRNFQVWALDASNPTTLPIIGFCNTPGGYAHNAWISEDDKILCATDEITRNGVSAHMTVYDLTTMSNTQPSPKVGDYDLGSNYVVHNVYVSGRTAYLSHYADGIHMVDLADPTNPTQLARYDTSAQVTGYNGAWGCYPFEDSGVIYGSDIENGLFALQMDRGHMNRYGTGTPSTRGPTPRARFDGASPRVNAGALRIECENLEPNRACWIVLAATPASAAGRILGAEVHVDLIGGRVVGPFAADAAGKLSIPAPVPNDTGLTGGRIYMQLFADQGNGTLSSSKGMWAGIAAR